MPGATKAKRSSGRSSGAKKTAERKNAREALNMRIRPEMRMLIDHAAELTGKNRTDFVLDAARQAAHNAVLDQTILSLNPKAYAAFVKLLDAPPEPNARLRRSMQTKPVWDK